MGMAKAAFPGSAHIIALWREETARLWGAGVASRQCAVALCVFAALSVRASAQTPPPTPNQPAPPPEAPAGEAPAPSPAPPAPQPSPPPEAPATGTPPGETPAVSAPESAAPPAPSNTTELPTITVSAKPPPTPPKRYVTPQAAAAAPAPAPAPPAPAPARLHPHLRHRRPTRLALPMWPAERPSCRKWRARWSFPARTSTLAPWQNLPKSSKRRPALPSSSIRAGARPISITCAATISTTAPTWRPSGTTCRSTCPPTRMDKATPTSIS